MNNAYLMYNNVKLDLGIVKAKVSTLPTTGISDTDKYWYTVNNSIYIYNSATTSWTIKSPTNGLKFLLESDGKTYVCYNGLFTDITAGSDAQTVNGHTVESDVPVDLSITLSDLQTDSHTHSNKVVLDKIDEDINGYMVYNGNPIIGGTTDYTVLTNKPSINSIELNGSKTLTDLGIQPSGNYALFTDIPDVSSKIETSNIIAGTGISLSVSGNDITINSDSSTGSNVSDSTINGNILVDGSELVVYELPLDIATISDIPNVSNKLEASNIIAGSNVTVSTNGNDLTINSTAISGSTVISSTTNGNILIDNVETNVYTLPSDVAKLSDIPDISNKLEASDLEAGDNITITETGGKLVFGANASSTDTVARQGLSDLQTIVDGKANTSHTHVITDITNLQTTLNNKIETSLIGINDGLATLDSNGKVTSSQLPNTYQLALGETSSDAYRGDRGKLAYDHSQLTNGNPHNVTKSDIGLSNVTNFDTTTTTNISDSLDKRFVTDMQKTVLSNTSGSNTGDETVSTIKTKLGTASLITDGYLTSTDFTTFNNKVDKITGYSLVSDTEIAKIHSSNVIGSKVLDETNLSNGKVIKYDSVTGTYILDDATQTTSTDQDSTGIATIITDIQNSTNSTPENTVGTLRDLRNIVKEVYPYDKTSTIITDIVTDVQTSTDTTEANTVSTLKDLRDVVKGNNVEWINSIDTTTTSKINDRLSYFDIGQDSTIGSIITILGNTAPQHYLKMDGATYNIDAYQDLSSFIEVQFGSKNYFGGDGVTTFAVPTSTPSESNAINCIKYEKIYYMGGIKTDDIFVGTANTLNTTYILTADISNYKALLIYRGITDSSYVTNAYVMRDFVMINDLSYTNLPFSVTSTYGVLAYTFAANTFTITQKALGGWKDAYIYKIVGIY